VDRLFQRYNLREACGPADTNLPFFAVQKQRSFSGAHLRLWFNTSSFDKIAKCTASPRCCGWLGIKNGGLDVYDNRGDFTPNGFRIRQYCGFAKSHTRL
jgi:hypothetical protein